MTRLCLFMICQVIIILLRTAWPGSASSVSVSPLSLSPSSRSADFLPAWLMGPFILDPTMSSAGLSIDQTKQEWQFRMLISVTAAVAALTKAIWPALQKMVKSTQRAVIWVLPVCFCLRVQTWPVEGRDPLSNIDAASYSALCQHCTF